MNLYAKLQLAKTEEDVKDAYLKALGLKGFSKNLIDIQTKEIWFEAKDGYKHSTYQMFTQQLHYVQQALKKGEEVRLIGFGTFVVTNRPASDGRNPRTGAAIRIPATRLPKFRAGKQLKEAVAK